MTKQITTQQITTQQIIKQRITRHSAWALLLLALVLLAACAAPATDAAQAQSAPAANAGSEPVELRIGYQRGGEWTLLKAQGALEKKFGPNVKVTWTLFTSGPPLLEALNAGAIDIGSTGETPPIFAQAAGTPLQYVAYRLGNGAGSGIVVSANSPAQSLHDLVGKKIAFTKASAAHLLLIKALQKEGLSYNDIEPVFLQPAEARAALEGGSIDAWVIWNPFYQAAVQELGARVLVNGGDVAPTRGYVLGSSDFVQQHSDVVRGVVEELITAQAWAKANTDDYAAILEKETEIPAAVWLAGFDSEAPEYRYLDEETIKQQQAAADIFYQLKLIPEPLDIAKAVWIGDAD